MVEEREMCEGCPTNPPCEWCPTRLMRQGRPQAAVPARKRKVRPELDRTKMGFGKHVWEWIDPDEIPTDFAHPEGAPRRDFNNAFNRANPETDVDLDVISRPGTIIETSAEGFEGQWIVRRVPAFTGGIVFAMLSREEEGEIVRVPMVSLGVVAERESNLYADTVITKLVSGGKANKDTRLTLTKKCDGSYK